MSISALDYPYEFASQIAEKYAADLRPLCEEMVVVGSLRRKSRVIHDIEFLVIPKRDPITDMFQAVIGYDSHLERNLVKLASRWGAVILRGGPQYKKLQMAEGINLEINISDRERWPVEIVIKTGPADFSHKCVTAKNEYGFLPSWAVIKDGWKVFNSAKRIEVKTEAEFLEFLGLGWIEPEDRK